MQKLTLKEKIELEEMFTSMKRAKRSDKYKNFYKTLIKKLLPTTKKSLLTKS
ncbi:hypothetical protein [Campylobacter geochelonis]|uniref:hypothetical protein n=1 Tax=Campylobacter geochelonis TaxID=1780362 RepID=UPI000770917E|nr:hypothetical protein [Campylobacter geochelonis]CZE47704.1 Uncharacterised protein [Campylobacter geochelonis]